MKDLVVWNLEEMFFFRRVVFFWAGGFGVLGGFWGLGGGFEGFWGGGLKCFRGFGASKLL